MKGKDRWRYQGKTFNSKRDLAQYITGTTLFGRCQAKDGMFIIMSGKGEEVVFRRSYTTDGLGVHNLREDSK